MTNIVESLDYQPSDRQKRVLHDIGEYAVGRALKKGEAPALTLWQRARTLTIPTLVIQQAIAERAAEWTVNVQTYKKAVQADVGYQAYGPLMIRLINETSETGYRYLQETELLINHAGYAVDVYPPQD